MLTTQQLQTLKTDLQANFPNSSEHEAAAAYNLEASPVYWAWRTSVNKHEYTQQTGLDTDGTTVTAFVWGGANGGYIARTQGERDAFKEIFNSVLTCNPSLPNVRVAFDDIFSGAGAGAVGNRAHMKAMGRRKVTRGEKLFVIATVGGPTQTGNRGATTNPDSMTFEGSITAQDVINALNS